MRFNPWRILSFKMLYNNYLRFLKKWVEFRRGRFWKLNAIRIMDQEWDYLIILDACRHDLFTEVVDNSAGFVISGASSTQGWLRWNFNGMFKDVIYVAGNPHFASANLVKTLGFNPFYKVIEVWDFGWDDTLKTVPPREVTLAALETLKQHPDKKMIIHYNQPHHPFLIDDELLRLDDGTWGKLDGGLWGARLHAKRTIWDAARFGKVPIEKVWEGYKTNLEIVMKDVNKVVDALHGRVIISADHGNHLGEYMVFGHPPGLKTLELVKVPWHVAKNEEREPFLEGKGADKRGDQLKLETRMIREKIRKLKTAGKV